MDTDSPHVSGCVGVALQNAFYELLHAQTFEQGLVRVIERGGDTDTNGVVVGSLLGAVLGKSAIPADWVATVTHVRTERHHQFPPSNTRLLDTIATELYLHVRGTSVSC